MIVTPVIGIDPGQKGGVAIIDRRTKEILELEPMPLVGREIDVVTLCDIITGCCITHDGVICGLEKVHAMPKQGVTSMFNFGRGFGRIEGMLMSMEISTIYHTPQAWKKGVLHGTTKDKAAAAEWAVARYPGVSFIPDGKKKIHDGIVDALCIAYYTASQ